MSPSRWKRLLAEAYERSDDGVVYAYLAQIDADDRALINAVDDLDRTVTLPTAAMLAIVWRNGRRLLTTGRELVEVAHRVRDGRMSWLECATWFEERSHWRN